MWCHRVWWKKLFICCYTKDVNSPRENQLQHLWTQISSKGLHPFYSTGILWPHSLYVYCLLGHSQFLTTNVKGLYLSSDQKKCHFLPTCKTSILFVTVTMCVGWDSAVGIAIHNMLDGPGIESRWRRIFSAPVHTSPGVHPASYTMGTGLSWG
jgi:hypothetical protein